MRLAVLILSLVSVILLLLLGLVGGCVSAFSGDESFSWVLGLMGLAAIAGAFAMHKPLISMGALLFAAVLGLIISILTDLVKTDPIWTLILVLPPLAIAVLSYYGHLELTQRKLSGNISGGTKGGYCKKCGSKLGKDMDYCPKCGEKKKKAQSHPNSKIYEETINTLLR